MKYNNWVDNFLIYKEIDEFRFSPIMLSLGFRVLNYVS